MDEFEMGFDLLKCDLFDKQSHISQKDSMLLFINMHILSSYSVRIWHRLQGETDFKIDHLLYNM